MNHNRVKQLIHDIWMDYRTQEFTDQINQIEHKPHFSWEFHNQMKQSITALPPLWEAILQNILAVHEHILKDRFQSRFYNRIKYAKHNYGSIMSLILYYLKTTDENYYEFDADGKLVFYAHNANPYFLNRPDFIPVILVTLAASEMYQYDRGKLLTFLTLCGLPKNTNNRLDPRKGKNDTMNLGKILIRGYFAAKAIQRAWRLYVLKKSMISKIKRIWKRQVSSPYTLVGKHRLEREFNEML